MRSNNYLFIFLLVISIFMFGAEVSAIDIYSSNPNAQTYITSNTNVTVQTYNQTWLNFDGSMSYVELGNGTFSSPNSNGNQTTIMFWYKFNPDEHGRGSTAYQFILSKYNANKGAWYFIKGNTTSAGTLKNNSVIFNQMKNDLSSSTEDIMINNTLPNTWYHISVRMNGSGMYYYVNGLYIGFRQITLYNDDGTAPLTIGKRYDLAPGVTQGFFNGSIDRLIIANITIRPAQVVGEYTNSNRAVSKAVPVLMYHYFKNNSAQTDELVINL